MKRKVWHALATLVCSLAVFVLPALAESQARIVRLSYLSGSVQIDRNTGQGSEKAIMNMPVTAGAQLKTADGQAEVEFENGSTVRLTPETRVTFEGLSLLGNGTKVSLITLQQGVAYFNLNHKDHNEFKVQFAGRDVELKKSARFRVDATRDQVRLAVLNGEVNVPSPGKNVAVHKNQTLSFDPDDEAQYALAKGIDDYQFDAWDSQRDQYQSQYSRVNYVGGSGVPYYGWDDLNYYGAYSYIPGYGYMWRPYGVGYGWDPFAVGYWMSYPWGYTWVSPYAWGWTPYRYGGWQFVSGYGWFWRPGPWRTWYPVPPVTGAPPAYRVPRPPMVPRQGVIAVGNPHPLALPPASSNFVGRSTPGGPKPRVMPLPTPNIITSGTDRPRGVPPERFRGPAGLSAPTAMAPGAVRTTAPSAPPQRSYSPPPPSSRPSGGGGPSGSVSGPSTHGGASGAHSGGDSGDRNPR